MTEEISDWSSSFVVKNIQNYYHTKLMWWSLMAEIISDCGYVRCWMH